MSQNILSKVVQNQRTNLHYQYQNDLSNFGSNNYANNNDYDKIRVYHDLPTLLDFLKSNKVSKKINFDSKNSYFGTDYEVNITDPHFKTFLFNATTIQTLCESPSTIKTTNLNPVSYTRKILELGNKSHKRVNKINSINYHSKNISPSSVNGNLNSCAKYKKSFDNLMLTNENPNMPSLPNKQLDSITFENVPSCFNSKILSVDNLEIIEESTERTVQLPVLTTLIELVQDDHINCSLNNSNSNNIVLPSNAISKSEKDTQLYSENLKTLSCNKRSRHYNQKEIQSYIEEKRRLRIKHRREEELKKQLQKERIRRNIEQLQQKTLCSNIKSEIQKKININSVKNKSTDIMIQSDLKSINKNSEIILPNDDNAVENAFSGQNDSIFYDQFEEEYKKLPLIAQNFPEVCQKSIIVMNRIRSVHQTKSPKTCKQLTNKIENLVSNESTINSTFTQSDHLYKTNNTLIQISSTQNTMHSNDMHLVPVSQCSINEKEYSFCLKESKSTFNTSVNTIQSSSNKSIDYVLDLNTESNDFNNLKNDSCSNSDLNCDIPDWNKLCERIYRINLQNGTIQNNKIDLRYNGFSNLTDGNSIIDQCLLPTTSLDSTLSSSKMNQIPHSITIGKSCTKINNESSIKDSSYCNNDFLNQNSIAINVYPSLNNATNEIRAKPSKSKTHLESNITITNTEIPLESIENIDIEKFIADQIVRIVHLRNHCIKLKKFSNFKSLLQNLSYNCSSDESLQISKTAQKPSSCRLFLFDLCKESILDTFSVDFENNEYSSNKLTLMLPLRMQKQPWPSDTEKLVQLVFERVKEAIGTENKYKGPENKCKSSIKKIGLLAYCRMQRKLDFVDNVLYHEMLLDEPRWCYFGPEMLELKERLSEIILQDLITEILKTHFRYLFENCLKC